MSVPAVEQVPWLMHQVFGRRLRGATGYWTIGLNSTYLPRVHTLLRRLTGLGDTQLGVTYTAGQTYNHITSSAPKTWSVHYDAVHCEGIRNHKFLPEVRDRLLRGFGLGP
jgi:hypothetical protein